MSTHGCFATSFPLYPFAAIRWWIPGARCHPRRLLLPPWGCILLRGAHRRPGVVRRSRAGGLASSIVDVCASLLKASLFNLCLYSDIVASADSLMYRAMYSSPRGPWLVIWSLYDFHLCLELCCGIFPWVSDLDRTRLRVWLTRGRHTYLSLGLFGPPSDVCVAPPLH